MKKLIYLFFAFLATTASGQIFDYYGPAPFGEILERSFDKPWIPTAISGFENKKYIIILDETQSNAIMLDANNINLANLKSIDEVNGLSSTYGSLMRSIFQMVDINTHEVNDPTKTNYVALEGKYRLNPMLHSYYALNCASDESLEVTDAGTYFIADESNTGYVLLEFSGTPSSASIKASSQWVYDASSGDLIEVSGWTDKWLKINGTDLSWTTTEAEASKFFIADATGLIELEIADGSDFNPNSTAYQLNATADIPDQVNSMDESKIVLDFDRDLDGAYTDQLGATASATTAASTMIDEIEVTLNSAGSSFRYPKEFYLALRENMLAQTVASTDIYGAQLGYNTVSNVYFTNATDDSGVPHPFMVITSHALSTRPNMLLDVNRPPGAEQGVEYGETTVTRNGKLGEFLIKIPLKDYGLIDNLLDNDLSSYGDLASEFDAMHATTSTLDVYNYTSIVSIAVAVDGVTIYPAYNNNLRFAVEDAEVTHSGIHVGGGLELHYHADGHGFNGNGINLYNLADFEGHDHPPVIGIAYDGIAIFGKYESSYPSMDGYSIALDEYGGHDHNDGFGYHYHAHTGENVENQASPGNYYDEHFLMVGAWKGNINDIPGFLELKTNQFKEESSARYVGASYTPVVTALSSGIESVDNIYPNPSSNNITIVLDEACVLTLLDINGRLIKEIEMQGNETSISIEDLASGTYLLKGTNKDRAFVRKFIVE